ncbi:S1C family serine protease [Treponema sp.]|uniref:S1C family serine protease n=1 Tax=Treponema sp. TaxID=166 RepID=UPI00388F4F68
MKLYTRNQIALYSALTGIVAGAAVAAGFFLFSGRESNHKNSAQVVSEEISTDHADDMILEEPSVLKVANDINEYTQDELQNISVYERCNEAVVNITTQTMGYNWFLEPVITGSGSGSGSIIDKRGYVVTNVHVIEDATTINISLADGSNYEGRVIGKDVESDIAVLKFDPDPKTDLKIIQFGASDTLKVGQKVIAIGNPFALERTMTTGIISGLGRPIQESSNVIIRNMIQTDAAINPGNSGGPLLDSKGRMIGINTIIYSKSGSSSGVGFAIPVSTARRVVRDLLAYGKVNRGTIQASFVQNTHRIAAYAGYKISSGLLVNKVRPGSKAAKAGLKGGTKAVQYGTFNPQTIYLGGDIIIEVDGIKIDGLADYYSALEDKKPGDKVNITVHRDGHNIGLTMELELEN